ncbi:fasciclin domain-containing protein [Streptosporangium sp. NPDC050855]|uniref:fasciclin domain-containing protein n=1 Tax=Streptosporangium sp. NPDC050855 TaxID=3366194 RepID=UPI0037B838B4
MKQKSLLASALTVLALTAAPVAAEAGTGAFARTLSPTPVPTDMTSPPMESPSPTDSVMPTDGASPSAGAAGEPFGPACASLPTSGPGSPAEMATQPVATAAASNPELSTLSQAIEQAGLTETLNSAKDITVFAPTNDAFDKIPKDTLDKVLADKEQLTKLLTYHVVEGKKTQQDLADGELTTMQGGTLAVQGSGQEYTVNDAKIVCGNVQTSNAVVYLVDTVLMPK